ncbi:YxeA family protein [Bacillus wiedmannii]|uniref:YxeA family protein n=1 Tax=Bacillus wiedmannii TaxID=1890302 RepID=UPI000BEE6A37|nr:YxeA family protein [Bacillus wiedmannii]PEF42801.1 hypothetical protein CON72_02565 [Bacillus wiedmannii]
MKRYIAFFSVFILCTSMLIGCNFNQMFKEKYYVQVTNDGQEEESRTSHKNYKYTLSGFNEEGKEKNMEFNADKHLRKEAFLCVYYDDKKGVTSWEEVQSKDIPEKAKQKLNVK